MGPADSNRRARGAAIESSEFVLRMCEITKDYQAVHALKRVDIQVSKGEIVGLVGANGAGKSTLVKILGGQLKNYSGTIAVNNVPVKLSSPTVSQKCRIGVLPQEPQFAWNLSIRDNLLLFGGERPPFLGASSRNLEPQASRNSVGSVQLWAIARCHSGLAHAPSASTSPDRAFGIVQFRSPGAGRTHNNSHSIRVTATFLIRAQKSISGVRRHRSFAQH